MHPTLARAIGNEAQRPPVEEPDYVLHPAIADPTRWMSWQEIADRLRILIKETEERFDGIDDLDLDRIAPEFVYARAANRGTVALDLVALRHAHAVATRFAIAFERGKAK